MKVRYHFPVHATWKVEPPSEERTRLERVILFAVERAVKSIAGRGPKILRDDRTPLESRFENFDPTRYHGDASAYGIPSYDAAGVSKPVRLISESEQITA